MNLPRQSSIMIKISIFLLLALSVHLAQSSSSPDSTAATVSLQAASTKQNDLPNVAKVEAKSAPVSGRAGRMLDLDKLSGDIGKSATKEASVSGNRQSRILSEDISVSNGGGGGGGEAVEERSKKSGNKKMSIKGFIPIVSMEGASQLSDFANSDNSNSEDNDDNEPQQQGNLREHLATSYGGQTSIGHASFPSSSQQQQQQQQQATSNVEPQWQQVDPSQQQQHQAGQLFSTTSIDNNNQQEAARANRKLLGTSNIFNSLTGGGHSPKRGLVSSLIPSSLALGASQTVGSYNYPQHQHHQQQQFIGGPMNVPHSASTLMEQPSAMLPSSSLASSECICVPFFQCKNGYLSESQLSKSQLAQVSQLSGSTNQINSLQVPRSLSSPNGQQANDLYYYAGAQAQAQSQPSQGQLSVASAQQGAQTLSHQQQQQVMNDIIYDQLRKNMESGQLDQQMQGALLDERNAKTDAQASNSTSAEGEERSLFNSLSASRRNYQLQQAQRSCGIMRTCCKIPPRMPAARFVNQPGQQQLFASLSSVGRPSSQLFSSSPQQMAHNRHLQMRPQASLQQQQQLQTSDFYQNYQIPPVHQLSQTGLELDQQQQQQQQTAAAHLAAGSLGQPLVMESIIQHQQLQNQLQPMQQKVAPLALPPQQASSGSFMSGRCGIRQTLGISGRVQNAPAAQSLDAGESTADFGEFPAHAAILKRLSPGDNLFVCSAVLISSQWLATAAHCVRKHRPEELKVRLGEWDVNRDDEFYPFFETNVREIVMNPDFQPSSLANDLALIRLDQAVDQQQMPHVAPACLAQPDDAAQLSGQRCWVAGWGKNAFGQQGTFQSVLKKVDLPVVSHQDCELALKYQTKLGKFFRLHANNICAGGERGKDACEGDGGAGLYCLDPQSTLIKAVGLVSWGVGCGQRGVPGVYVNLANFNTWIESVVVSSGEENVYLDGRMNGIGENNFKNIISERSNEAKQPQLINATLSANAGEQQGRSMNETVILETTRTTTTTRPTTTTTKPPASTN